MSRGGGTALRQAQGERIHIRSEQLQGGMCSDLRGDPHLNLPPSAGEEVRASSPARQLRALFTESEQLHAQELLQLFRLEGSPHLSLPPRTREEVRGFSPSRQIRRNSLTGPEQLRPESPADRVYKKRGANTRATIDISLMRMFSDGPEVSLKGSPTVSPTTAAA